MSPTTKTAPTPGMQSATGAAPLRLDSVDALGTPEGLARVLGPVAAVERTPLTTPGKSGAVLTRLAVRLATGEERRLVLKRSRLADDFGLLATGDHVGREAALLAEPSLAGVWRGFACPYRAYAAQDGMVGLLMDDLGEFLVADVDQPISEQQEDALLAGLAAMHAHYWQHGALALPWLMPPAVMFGTLAPRTAGDPVRRSAAALFDWVDKGWAALRSRVSEPFVELLLRPDAGFSQRLEGLPRTLVHLDTRLVNVAFLPGGDVAALDWQLVGAGPPTLDLGVYLIGNPRCRARPAGAVIDRYRALLEAKRGAALADDLWERMLSAGLLYGAAMLLWDRALDLEEGERGAAEEWRWWVDQLQQRWP